LACGPGREEIAGDLGGRCTPGRKEEREKEDADAWGR
jgi:hypothetical protein